MSKDFNSFMTGLAVGALAGTAAGILLAPKSGVETREDIKHFAGDVRDRTQDLYTRARNSVQRKVKSLKDLGEKIDETKYSKLVEEVVDEYKQKDLLSSESAKDLGNQLKKDWTTVKKAIAA